MLFRRQQQVVVRLPAVLDVHLDARVLRADPSEQAVQLRRPLTGEDREHAPRLCQQAGDNPRVTQDKMLAFWGKVVHDNTPLDDASQSALGASWTTVSADCASYIRRSVG